MTAAQHLHHPRLKLRIAELRRGDIHRQQQIVQWLQFATGAFKHKLAKRVDQTATFGDTDKRIRRQRP
jgi:hypothetical protein